MAYSNQFVIHFSLRKINSWKYFNHHLILKFNVGIEIMWVRLMDWNCLRG